MLSVRQVAFLLCGVCALALVAARPDSGESPPLPGPGLSYGGIPYGSMSGNVAEYFRQRATPSGYRGHLHNDINFAPIEQYL